MKVIVTLRMNCDFLTLRSWFSFPICFSSYGIAQVANFHTFWQDGLAFCAIIDRHRPDLLNYEECRSNTPSTNLELAMGVAEKELKIVKLIDPQG